MLNPVRAQIVAHPRDWPWSSYRATAGETAPPSFLTITTVLGQFADDHTSAQAAYIAYIEAGIGVDPPVRIGGIYSGSSDFAGAHEPRQRIDEVPRRQWDPIPPPLEQLFATSEDTAIADAYQADGYTLRQIGEHLGLHYSTVSRRLQAIEDTTRHSRTDPPEQTA